MQNSDDNDTSSGMDFFIVHPGRKVDVSHYFRQIVITQRRHAPWINRIWSQNRRLPAKASVWKH